jgi:2-hydroxychromene-2-carboxylate isomerase
VEKINVTIRNIDPEIWQRFRSLAVAERVSVGEKLNQIMEQALWAPGTELSQRDAVLVATGFRVGAGCSASEAFDAIHDMEEDASLAAEYEAMMKELKEGA